MILKFVEDLQFLEYTAHQRGFNAMHNDCGNKGDLKILLILENYLLLFN